MNTKAQSGPFAIILYIATAAFAYFVLLGPMLAFWTQDAITGQSLTGWEAFLMAFIPFFLIIAAIIAILALTGGR